MRKESRLAQRKLKEASTIALKPKKRSNIPVILFFILLFFAIIFTLFFVFTPSIWTNKSKLSIATEKNSGDVAVIILDGKRGDITTIQIPGDTEVEAANELGTWKIRSITKLGIDKNLGEDFLKNTIIKSFKFPINSWSDENIINLTSGNLLKTVRAVFSGNITSFSFFDKIRIAAFALSVGNSGRTNIDLSKTDYLNRSKLTDGSLGWEISTSVPTNIESYFTNDFLGSGGINVLINNGSGVGEAGSMFGKVLEVMGLNIASVQNTQINNSDCLVTGTNSELIGEIADMFTCKKNISKPQDNFDIEIDLGNKFVNRF